jgi:hypothetical protein
MATVTVPLLTDIFALALSFARIAKDVLVEVA